MAAPKWHHCTGRRRRATRIGIVSGVRHHAWGIAVRRVLRYVGPLRARVVRGYPGTRCMRWCMRCIARVVVVVFQSVVVGGLGPVSPRAVCASTLAPAAVLRRRCRDGDVLVQGGATGRLRSRRRRYGRRCWGDPTMPQLLARTRVRGVDLVNVVVSPLVSLAIFVVLGLVVVVVVLLVFL